MAISPTSFSGGDIPDQNSEEYQKFAKGYFNLFKNFTSMLSESMDLNLSGDPSQGLVKDEEEEE